MLRSSRSWATAAGVALTLMIATPGLASARPSAPDVRHTGANNVAGAQAVFAKPVQPAAAPQAATAFPSATSTVIASTGFINDTEVGYFWSAARGDSVEQTVSCKAKVKKAIFKLNVPENFLAGADTDWTASINGTDIGSFVVSPGQVGPLTAHYHFAKIKTGGSCDVKIRVTNEVPGGDGSIALTYAGSDPHSVKLK